jgi:hypothetical protein
LPSVENLDEFAALLLEEAKRFVEKAEDNNSPEADTAYLHAALMLAFCSLEAHVNIIGEDFIRRSELSLHEKATILEQEVRLEDGEFKMVTTLRMIRLEDRIRFLHVRFGKPLDKSAAHWAELSQALALRNRLTHPKAKVDLTRDAVARAIKAIIDTLDALYRAIYRRPFPLANAGMVSIVRF